MLSSEWYNKQCIHKNWQSYNQINRGTICAKELPFRVQPFRGVNCGLIPDWWCTGGTKNGKKFTFLFSCFLYLNRTAQYHVRITILSSWLKSIYINFILKGRGQHKIHHLLLVEYIHHRNNQCMYSSSK